MSGVGAKSFTFQLSSKHAEKTGSGVEQFRLALEPGISVPFTAQPRCALEQLAFTQTVTNVDAALYGNNTIVFEWDPFYTLRAPGGGTLRRYSTEHGGKSKRYEMTIPDGTYSLQDLELFIARELYQAPCGEPRRRQAWDN